MFVITAILVLFIAALPSQAFIFEDHDGCKLVANKSTACEKHYDCGVKGVILEFRTCELESPKNCGVKLEAADDDGCCTFCPCRDSDERDANEYGEGEEFMVGKTNPHVKKCKCSMDYKIGKLVARCKKVTILPPKQPTRKPPNWGAWGKRRR
ncbi:uncharacterized protein LOC116604239 [Nematostella vectensis]|uniref:uncharacterized protein LOC116604239 n=1 Tax=Nematostella vectensis TaxID=45351 RepID=UPI0013906AAD|nr:uncharacterized protein LOC116604239 [Nematostella vectensis]